MRSLFTFFMFWTSVALVSAQSFSFSATAPSGQTIYYQIIEGTHDVAVVNPSYDASHPAPTGDLVLPETVSHEGVEYVVRKIASQAFEHCYELNSLVMSNRINSIESNLNYSSIERIVFSDSIVTFNCYILPIDIKSLTLGTLFTDLAPGNFSSGNSMRVVVDTLCFRSSLGASHLDSWKRINTIQGQFTPFKVIKVPCGEMQAFYENGWNQMGPIRTDCCDLAIPLNIVKICSVTPFSKGHIQRDAGQRSDFPILGNTHPLGLGDTLYCEHGEEISLYWVHAHDSTPAGDPVVDHWSLPGVGNKLTFVATDDIESITAYLTTKPHASLNCNNISTLADCYGGLGFYNGKMNYAFNGEGGTIFATGLWMGGIADGEEHVSAMCYGTNGRDYRVGPIGGEGSMNGDSTFFWNHVWKISRSSIDYHLAHCSDSYYSDYVSTEIYTWPGPYVDVNGDGAYTPMQGDYPLIRGDVAVLSIFNDQTQHDESGGKPLGMDVQMMAYAFLEGDSAANSNPLNNTIFVDYKVMNHSNVGYSNFRLGNYIDYDLGGASDDYIGSDVTRQMSYCFNGDESDLEFSGIPPAQGCAVMSGAKENGVDLGLSEFVYFDNSSNNLTGHPTTAKDFYNYLNGRWRNGYHMLYGGNGCNMGIITPSLECRYMYPGDSDPQHIGTNGVVPSAHPDDWTEFSAQNVPGDRRGLNISGPFNFPAGNSQTFSLAYVTSQALEGSSWSSVELMKTDVDEVRRQYLRDTTDSGRPFTYMPQNGTPVGISEADKNEIFSVYPNPTSGRIHLVTSGEGVAELYDIMGHHVGTFVLSDKDSDIDLSSLPQGIYLLRLNGTVKKVVKK